MHTITIIVLPADHEQEVGYMTIDSGDLSAFQGLVGGNVEAIDLNAQQATMWVHDEHKFSASLVNARATMSLWLSDPIWRFRDHIRGDAFLTGLPDENGDSTSVPDELFQLFFRTEKYKAEVQLGDDQWSGNDVVFDEYFDAAGSVLDLASRWSLVTHCRVVAA